MTPSACSLQIMDIRLLKLYVAVLRGQPVPDMREEAMRRRQRDILINWSQRIARAAAPLASAVSPDDWAFFTQVRPFFITAESSEDAIAIIEQLYDAHKLDDVLNIFLGELARIDAEQALTAIARAREDATPVAIDYLSVDEIETNFRVYLLHERHQIEALSEKPNEAKFPEAGRWIAWRAAMLLANMAPWWYSPSTTLTAMSTHPALGLERLVADPRGMYAAISQKVSHGFHEHIPYALSEDEQTGMCIPPQFVASSLAQIAGWPAEFPAAETPPPTRNEIRALREALLYAQKHQAGVWEIAGMVDPTSNRLPTIMSNQADREERPEKYAVTAQVEANIPFADDPLLSPEMERQQEILRRMEATAPVTEVETTDEPAEQKTPWWKRLGKRT